MSTREMTPAEAYVRGQEDMRRRIEKALRGWVFPATMTLGVPTHIRLTCKVRPLAAQEETA